MKRSAIYLASAALAAALVAGSPASAAEVSLQRRLAHLRLLHWLPLCVPARLWL